MKTQLLLAVVTIASLGGAACTFPSSGRLVSPRTVGQVQRIEYGTVEKVNPVVVQGRRGPIGTLGGGLTGAAAASGVGHGVGRGLARAGGAVVGAVVGEAVEEVATRKAALEMVIKMDGGALVVLTQDDPRGFNVGDRVAVASGGGGSKVMYP